MALQPSLEFIYLGGQLTVSGQQLPQANKGSHYEDAHLHCAF